jgi:hypothetical protein
MTVEPKREEFWMALLVISASLFTGAAFASAAARSPGHAPELEWCGGVMLVGGLGLLGAMLPHVGYM